MFSYSNNGITIASILDQRRELKEQTYPIKIRVTFKRRRVYYSTGKSLSKADWEKLPITKSKKQISLKTDVQHSFDKVKSAVVKLERDDKFSFIVLNNYLGNGVGDTLNVCFKTKLDSLLQNDQINTHEYYSYALKSIESFAGENIPLDFITPEWLQKYEKFQLKEGKSYTTIGMRGRAIRTVLNSAKEIGLIKESQYPFGRGKYKIPTGEGRKLALNLEQIKNLITYTDGSEATEHYRDLWFFSYLCNGINFADLITLKYSNIKNDELYFIRSKTIKTSRIKKDICAVITPEMQAIMDRWGTKDKNPDNYIFGFLKGGETPLEIKKRTRDVISNCNRRLRKIGKAMNIAGLSTYTARHSYATVLKRSGANIAYISESLGHKDLKTTENYLASFEKEERVKNASLLTNFGE
ncbi:site-specific integrase [uncultured Draconibacterium sp.]|uniref:site-specific integrase n=1 Tax=uncultured Draconibacterium sp. TaxID=1573823 RepID=UPI0025CF9553|nr:site-specific integrase [uncultured Draconibacterium sp.]